MTGARMWIARHGNTFQPGEATRRCGGGTDLPLTTEGIDQAGRLARHFAMTGIRFDRVLVAPLRRTRLTAEIIAAEQPRPVAIQEQAWLTEIDHGPDENVIEPLVEARVGRAALIRWNRSAVPPPGWVVDAERLLAGWRALFAASSANTLIVTSNGVARFALVAADAARHRSSLALRTGAFGQIERHGLDQLRLIEWDSRPTP